jgi:8-oxo-dGTP pyrophosphatase MutT (NUDIX family)
MRRAAGFVLFAGPLGQRRVLLLRNARHHTWAFPKGHLEAGEDLMDGARRELQEETGITAISVDPVFHRVSRYRVPPGSRPGDPASYEKEVHHFLAHAPSEAWVRSSEHDDGGFMTVAEALLRLRHPDLRETLLAACRHLGEPCPS